jgi:hypothetical protein
MHVEDSEILLSREKMNFGFANDHYESVAEGSSSGDTRVGAVVSGEQRNFTAS